MKQTSWGKFASWYDDLLGGEDTYQKAVILPNLMRAMGIAQRDVVLDLACGQGFFAQEFNKAGATVVGADISSELISLAREKSSKDIEFHVAPADNLKFLKNQSIDKVAIILAIQNIENIAGMLKECARVLGPEGSIFIVMNHPAFRIPKKSSWGWDNENNIQYRRIDEYMTDSKVKMQMHPGERPKETTISFHRSLQVYFKAIRNAGFMVAELEEWISHKVSEPGPRSKAEDRARKEFPIFMMIKAIKLSQ
ncbi:MAG: methyltransferase domain-containing protein [Candidatus Colwellbacteria bacterium]|nr:methyltransferase domain-containing protein [Candidatus Colwellbacteria bacterium]